MAYFKANWKAMEVKNLLVSDHSEQEMHQIKYTYTDVASVQRIQTK
jgi:hypothetical protein